MAIRSATKRAADVADYIKRQFGDESAVQVTDSDLLRWINDGQMEIVSVNRILRAKASAGVLAGQDTYDLPNLRVIAIEAVHVNGRSVEHMAFQDVEKYLIQNDPERTQTGQPRYWYDYGDQITFWPRPDTTAAGGLVIFYIKEPDPVASLDDLLTIPDKYYNTLARYVLTQAYEMDEDWQAARLKGEQFTADLANYAEEEVTLSAQTYPTITIY